MRYLITVGILLSLATGPIWAQGALQLADLPELEETEEVDTEEAEESEEVPPDSEKKGPVGEVYGFVMTDVIYDGGTIDPNWTDAARFCLETSFADRIRTKARIAREPLDQCIIERKQSELPIKEQAPQFIVLRSNGNDRRIQVFANE